MKTVIRHELLSVAILAGLLGQAAVAQTTYNQATVSAFVTGTNLIDTDATINTAATFRTAVATAWSNGRGGVFNLPTSVAGGTMLYRGTYGSGKRMHITTSTVMQNITSGTFIVASSPNGTTSQTNQSDYTLTFGLFSTNTGLPLLDETVKEVGLPILSRNAIGYPLDLRVTVTFSDGSTQAVTSAIASGPGADDTFFGFTAPEGLGIASLRLQSFVPGTSTPVADRIGWDDFGFITGPASVVPQPQIVNISPAAYAIHNATNGIHFEALTYVAIDPTNISLVLNSNNVSSQLIVSGNPTNYSVSYFGLVTDKEYQMIISVTNAGGTAVLERTFYTRANAFVLYDSAGFTNDTLYPLGALQAVTDGRATWAPAAVEPAQIVDAGAPHTKTLERLNTGISRADFLNFPPLSSGTLTIEFDAFISTTLGRTIDIALMPLGSSATTMASFLAWGDPAGKLAYFDNVNWLPLADLSTDWHHCKIVNYLSGPSAGRYDVIVNGLVVAQRLPWRNAQVGSAFSRFRIQSQNTGPVFDFGRIDNLVITAAPEDPNAFPPPLIVPVSPPTDRAIVRTSEGMHFGVTSQSPLFATNIGVVLNGQSISGALQLTGPNTNLAVAYPGLQAETNYVAAIGATNSYGAANVTLTFISTEQAWLYDPSDGWLGPWQYTSGIPEMRTANALATNAPYVRLDILGGARNLMRQYAPGTLDISQPHFIRWKFRLSEPDFAANFTTFNDRVHFFARNAPRLTAGTDAANSWAISATGAEQTPGSGISAGQRFYIFDNLDGSGNYNLANLVDSLIPVIPDHVYSFEVLVFPQSQTYSVKIADETSSAAFQSAAPHKFRSTGVTATSHTLLHFGVQANTAATPRAFDFGLVSITPAAPAPITLANPVFAANVFSFSFQSRTGVSHVTRYSADIGLGSWTSLVTNIGDGTLKTVSHTNPPSGRSFYRVDSQIP